MGYEPDQIVFKIRKIDMKYLKNVHYNYKLEKYK